MEDNIQKQFKEMNIDVAAKIKELEDLKYAIDQSMIVDITDEKGIITEVNDKFCEISKFRREELIGKTYDIVNSDYHSKEFFEELWNTVTNGKVWEGDIRNKAKDGSYFWVKTTIIPFLDEDGVPQRYIEIRQDITAQKEAETKISHNAYHDELTGLRNRRYLNDEIRG